MAPALPVLRPLTRADFPLLAEWLSRPHVAAWWGPPRTAAGIEAEFGPCIDRTDPTEVFIAASTVTAPDGTPPIDTAAPDGTATPIGLVQIYRLSDNADYEHAVGVPNAAGIDLLIGDVAQCGRGNGPLIIAEARRLVWLRYPEVTQAMAGPSVRNTRSHRAFEKAGFTASGQVSVPGEDDDELVFVCPRPTGA